MLDELGVSPKLVEVSFRLGKCIQVESSLQFKSNYHGKNRQNNLN